MHPAAPKSLDHRFNEYFSVRNYLKILWKLVELNHQEDLLPLKGLSFEEIYFQPNDFSDELKLKILLLFFKNAKVNLPTYRI